jgi:hypothetical protein
MLTAYNAEGEALSFAHPIDVQEGIASGALFAENPKGKAKPAAKEEPKAEAVEEPTVEAEVAPKAHSRQPPARRA